MSQTKDDGRSDREQRSQRKDDHLRAAASLSDGPGHSWLECVHLVHNCLPEVDPAEVNLRTVVAGIELKAPLIINAVTGGSQAATEINAALGSAAGELGLAIAVGSQQAALDDARWIRSFTVVRDEAGDVPVLANVGVCSSVDDALRAVEMVDACALQVHLNVMHELVMVEGERSFTGHYRRLEEIVRRVSVPVIVKEVGFGIARREAQRLFELGAAAIDVGGRGGTNFLEVEWRRSGGMRSEALSDWGIPTAASIIECAGCGYEQASVIGSGGIRSGVDVARALALGAVAVGVAGPLVKILARYDRDELVSYCRDMLAELRMVMVAVGCGSAVNMKDCQKVIMPPLQDWLRARGI